MQYCAKTRGKEKKWTKVIRQIDSSIYPGWLIQEMSWYLDQPCMISKSNFNKIILLLPKN